MCGAGYAQIIGLAYHLLRVHKIVYSRLSKELRQKMSPSENGSLPLEQQNNHQEVGAYLNIMNDGSSVIRSGLNGLKSETLRNEALMGSEKNGDTHKLVSRVHQ